MMKKLSWILLAAAVVLLAVSPAFAQGDDILTLRMTRDFGYGGFNGDIEGLFSVIAEGSDTLQRVEFYIDGELMNADDAAPFRYQFTTKSYAPGTHTLSARGFTSDGAQLQSNELTRVFLSPDEARSKVVGIILPLLGIVLLIATASILLPTLFGRGKPQPGKYGMSGGAVCTNCALPFPIHFFSFHAGAKNLERCPHCGKWVWVRKANKEDLAAAEARWQGADSAQFPAVSKSDRLQKQIDDSRYEK
jgi:hypothetical protein